MSLVHKDKVQVNDSPSSFYPQLQPQTPNWQYPQNKQNYCDLDNCSPWQMISLPKGLKAIVDRGDYEYLTKWKWRIKQTKDRTVVFRRVKVSASTDKMKDIFMHHEVSKLHGEKWCKIKHLNGIALDNRFSNLASYKSGLPYSPHASNSRISNNSINVYLRSFQNRLDRVSVSNEFQNSITTSKAESILEQNWKEINFLKSQRLKTAFAIAEIIDSVNQFNLKISSSLPSSLQERQTEVDEVESIRNRLESILQSLHPRPKSSFY